MPLQTPKRAAKEHEVSEDLMAEGSFKILKKMRKDAGQAALPAVDRD